MSLARLKQALAPLYAKLDPGSRMDLGERLADKARQLAQATDEGADLESVEVLALTWPVREAVRSNVPARTSVETALVELGWTPLKIRELVRALERLPDRPTHLAEKAVADADTYWSLGLAGYTRAVTTAAARGEGLAEMHKATRRILGRRLFLTAAQAECQPRRERLAELLRELEADLK